MRIHLIACGGAVMHNLTIALYKKGNVVTGSDDEIFEPAKSRLAKYDLLPQKKGWHPENITSDIDIVILGMHARKDNPELLKAQELGLKIYSFPEFIYEQSKNKKRIVIGGSHGKTTITSMIMHVLRKMGKDFDYMVGAQIEGFDTMVKLTNEADIIILEGDEYLSSAIDMRPKFLLYKADIGVISGIAWDHMNVFPTFDIYKNQFEQFINTITPQGSLFYCADDENVEQVVNNSQSAITKIPYGILDYIIEEGNTYLLIAEKKYPIQVFGKHNIQNIHAAKKVCEAIGIKEDEFAQAIGSFTGAAKRLEKVDESGNFVIYRDFAHSPSKLKATVHAVREQYENRKVIACMELHTFSSLKADFIENYKGTMNEADEAIVYYNPFTIAHKKLEPISENQVLKAFDREDLKIYQSSADMKNYLYNKKYDNSVLLMMSSGNFDGIDIYQMASELLALNSDR